MKHFFQKDSWKKYFYFLCFFILCICDQRIGSAGGEIQFVCPNLVLIVLNCIALSHYSAADFRRRSFWIPVGVCTAAALAFLCFLWLGTRFHYQLISGVVAAVLYCCVIIQAAFAIYSKKRLPRGKSLGIWLVSLILVFMLLSQYDKYSGVLLWLSVLLIYLTDFTEEEWKALGGGLCSAVLASFFVIQGLAFVFRPYDKLRYLGMYANTNMNALFYQIIYCVFLGCFCVFELKKKHCFWKWVSFCFACSMWSFVLLTMCRTAILGMAAATLLGFCVVLWRDREKRLRRGLVCFCGMLIGSILSFPVVYGAVRYLPPVFHHPIWFMAEYSEEKVHSWDPYDSEKYTDWRDVLQGNFGRLFSDFTVPKQAEEEGDPVSVIEEAPVILLASGKTDSLPDLVPEATVSEKQKAVASFSTSARLTIYRHYLSNLNLRGHGEAENGVQVDENYYAPHAHNIILQYAFNYGVPVGILLFLYLAASGIRFLQLCLWDKNGTEVITGLLLFAAIAVFGMLEVTWRYGQLSNTLLLILPCFAWHFPEKGAV